MPFDAVLDAVTRAAVDATGAIRGWIIEPAAGELRVVAAAGDDARHLVDAHVDGLGSAAGLVLASGSPMARVTRPDDPAVQGGVAALVGVRPSAILCVPCGEDDVVAVLELVDKAGGVRFTFDDVELATLLAGIAGTALATRTTAPSTTSPAELGGALARLAHVDPGRYATIATIVGALLDGE